eukprot:gene11783-15766_t
MDQYEFEKYAATPATCKETLDKYGVCIIPSVLSPEECQQMVDGMWTYLERTTSGFDLPIQRNKPKTYREFSKLLPLHSMLVQHWGIGHAQYIWDLRENPKVLNIFSEVWDTPAEELLVSFDGASIHLPSEITNLGWYRNHSWLHSDQSYCRNDFECIQSWVTAFDVNEGDATLTILESSHLYHKEFAQTFNVSSKADWYKLGSLDNNVEVEFYKSKGCEEKHIKCPAGSLVLWDSRTIHCGREPMKGRSQPNIRCVVYLCYTPRALVVSQKDLEKKRKAFEEMRMTSHWPHRVKLFPKTPRTYGNTLPNVVLPPPPTITSIGRRLAGFDN